MRIGIIGSGNIGATGARLFVNAGHEVAIANSRGPETLTELDDDSTTSSELLAAHLPEARVVKAFNSLYWKVLRDRANPDAGDRRLVLFVAGDDEEAKAKVSALIEEIGFAPVDSGNLAEGGRRQQPGSPVSGELLTEAGAKEALALP
jgi:predicted dinucleotide-binding enzyme